MEIKTLACSSLDGRVLNQEVIMDFSGKMAGICCTSEDLDVIMNEPMEHTIQRAVSTLANYRHSVFGHGTVTLYLEGIPKILAIILNNEGLYNTSENSARYMEVKTSGEEQELYEKWKGIFTHLIQEKYPNMDEEMVKKYALENACYLISIFTPSTNMAYTTNVQQLNYMYGWMKDFVKATAAKPPEKLSQFDVRLSAVFSEFICKMNKNLIIPGLLDPKKRGFSLFAKRDRDEEWGENYCINYFGSFAQLAQAQLHRALNYEFRFIDFAGLLSSNQGFFIPAILYGGRYEKDWLDDAEKLEANIPQGTMININERGTCENFVLKCSECLCGQAQLEICVQTASTLNQYYWRTHSDTVRKYLDPYVNLPRCKSFDMECKRPCFWGADYAFKRLV